MNRRSLHRGHGAIAIMMAVAFMVLAVPLVTGVLGSASTLSTDSRVKTEILKRHYSVFGAIDYAIYRLRYEPGYADSLELDTPQTFTVTMNGRETEVTLTLVSSLGGPGEQGEETARFGDIVLALDVSGSVNSTELQQLKNAANTIVDELGIGVSEGRMRMGIRRFRGSSASVTAMTDVDDHNSQPPVTPLHAGINGLQQGGPGLASGTNLVAALQGAAAQFSTGLGDREDVPNIIIVITDGNDTWGNSLAAIETASLSTGAEVFAVGVGSDIDIPVLDAIATDDDPSDPGYNPADPNAGHRFHTDDFSGLLEVIGGLIEAVSAASQDRTIRIRAQATGYSTTVWIVLPPAGP